MQYVFILGRQPELGRFELERVFGNAQLFSPASAIVSTDRRVDVQLLGGSIKAATITKTFTTTSWNDVCSAILRYYESKWSGLDRKQTVGLSVYGWNVTHRQVESLGLSIKKAVKKSGTSLRLIPSRDTALSSATSHHNKLGLSENKTEIILIRHGTSVLMAESVGSQNITAPANRDQARPKTDAFVGMLPPKLALMMINMACGANTNQQILDPFCGTGVVLQEALLQNNDAYGTDLSQKMVDYGRENLQWLAQTHNVANNYSVELGDATSKEWSQPIDAVVCETYLGQPFSAPPSVEVLEKVQRTCDSIISGFLRNIRAQLSPSATLCIAVPAWRANDGTFTYLKTIRQLESLGFSLINLNTSPLLYYRESQVVARQLLVLRPRV